jgi:hypothetical protein
VRRFNDLLSSSISASPLQDLSGKELPVLGWHEAFVLWDQYPSRYQVARSLKMNDEYKELAAVAASILITHPE